MSAREPGKPTDPVRARRAQIAKWTLLANRVGYLCFGIAIAVFVFGFAIGFTPPVVTVVVVAMVVGSVLLAPAIVHGYAVKEAERDDRERERHVASVGQHGAARQSTAAPAWRVTSHVCPEWSRPVASSRSLATFSRGWDWNEAASASNPRLVKR